MSIDVELSRDGAVETWWLNRVDARNAISLSMWESLREHSDRVRTTRSVRAVVVRGRGPHFSAGADIVGLGRQLAGDTSETTYRATNAAAELAITTLPLPVVAAIDGYCVGGGVQLALACDIRIATSRARFAVTPAKLGIVYPVGALARLVSVVGVAVASELLLTGDAIDVTEAHRVGLVSRIDDDLDHALDTVLASLLSRSPLTQAASKEVIHALTARLDVHELGRELEHRSLLHGDLDEGLAAFSEKREARFGDRPAEP